MSFRSLVNIRYPVVGQWIRVLRLLPGIHNIPLLMALTRCQVWPDKTHYDRKSGRLYLPQYGVTVWLDRKDGLIAEASGLLFPIDTGHDLDTIREVVTDQVYASLQNFRTDKPVVIWDVGMNIGVVSIWLARLDNVVDVYGYEPFPHTFKVAQKAFSLNKELSAKIHPSNAGLGGKDEQVTAEYSPLYKASMSAGAAPTDLSSTFSLPPSDVQALTIKILDASRILREIASNHEEADLLAKIDCEGAEYDIITSLKQQNLLRLIAAAEIECHDGRTEEINAQLLEEGFETTQIVVTPGKVDLIRAVRIGSSPARR